MTTSAIESLLSAILLGAMLTASAPAAADPVTDSDIASWVIGAREDWAIRDDVDFESRVEDGVFTLTGQVHDGTEKSHAADVAGRVRAVCEVVNEIRVQAATGTITKHSDTTLAKGIRDRFQRHWTTSRVASRIRVDVTDGVATLTGDLDTWDERLEAGRVAFGTEGVWKVQNQLTVKGYDYEWERWEYEAPDYYEDLFPDVG